MILRPESDGEKRFRAEVREWLERNLPADLRHLTFRAAPAVTRAWHRKLADRGWIAPHWPTEHGGMDASPVEQLILMEEFARAGAPDISGQGLNHIGPVLMRHGTAEQKQHLPRILCGDEIWCQGYSEPNAGSDLAGLRTAGRIDGDAIIVNGQKTWTTWADNADWMFALVRTGQGATRRDGITFLLIDLSSPGVTRKPIITIAGDNELCEVFFDEVHVPVANVVGKIGEGWPIATGLLSHERRAAGPFQALKGMERVHALLRHRGVENEPLLGDRVAALEIEVAALCSAYLQDMEDLRRSDGQRRDSSYFKLLNTETTQAVLDLAQEIAGTARARKAAIFDGASRIDFSEMYLQSRRQTILGGTAEVQRNLVASRALGLKRDLP